MTAPETVSEELSPEEIADREARAFSTLVREVLDRSGYRETRIIYGKGRGPSGVARRYDPNSTEGYRCYWSFDPPKGLADPDDGRYRYFSLRVSKREKTTLKAMGEVLRAAGIENVVGATRFRPSVIRLFCTKPFPL